MSPGPAHRLLLDVLSCKQSWAVPCAPDYGCSFLFSCLLPLLTLHMPKGTLRCLISLLGLDMCLSKKMRPLLTFLVSVFLLKLGMRLEKKLRVLMPENLRDERIQLRGWVNMSAKFCGQGLVLQSYSSANKHLLIWIIQNIKLTPICMFTNQGLWWLVWKWELPGWIKFSIF